jgi:hypothetical protein
MLAAHESQLAWSLPPVEQIGCAHDPPPQDCWQIEETSRTQMESHATAQQKPSTLQMDVAHGSQPVTSLLPVEQMACVQMPPPEHWPLELQVAPPVQAPQVPPQPSLPQTLPLQLGVQALVHWPLELQLEPLAQAPQVPLQPSLPQTLPLQLGVQVEPEPPARAAPFGVPMPVGPSHPAPALHRTLPHEPFDPLVTSKKELELA